MVEMGRKDCVSLGSGANAKEQVGVGLGWAVVLLAFTRALHACFVKQEYNNCVAAALVISPSYLGCCYERLGISFKDPVFITSSSWR